MKRLLITDADATEVIHEPQLVLIAHIQGSAGFKDADAASAARGTDNPILWLRGDAEFNGKAFGLSSAYDWTIGTDSEGLIVLVPTRKKQ